MNSDQVKGKAKTGKGKVKEAAGKALDDKKLEKKGSNEKETGKAQSAFGDLKKDIKKN